MCIRDSLKGPNASALYGARAANGVILITTKSGKGQKGLGVTYSSTVSFETAPVSYTHLLITTPASLWFLK